MPDLEDQYSALPEDVRAELDRLQAVAAESLVNGFHGFPELVDLRVLAAPVEAVREHYRKTLEPAVLEAARSVFPDQKSLDSANLAYMEVMNLRRQGEDIPQERQAEYNEAWEITKQNRDAMDEALEDVWRPDILESSRHDALYGLTPTSQAYTAVLPELEAKIAETYPGTSEEAGRAARALAATTLKSCIRETLRSNAFDITTFDPAGDMADAINHRYSAPFVVVDKTQASVSSEKDALMESVQRITEDLAEFWTYGEVRHSADGSRYFVDLKDVPGFRETSRPSVVVFDGAAPVIVNGECGIIDSTRYNPLTNTVYYNVADERNLPESCRETMRIFVLSHEYGHAVNYAERKATVFATLAMSNESLLQEEHSADLKAGAFMHSKFEAGELSREDIRAIVENMPAYGDDVILAGTAFNHRAIKDHGSSEQRLYLVMYGMNTGDYKSLEKEICKGLEFSMDDPRFYDRAVAQAESRSAAEAKVSPQLNAAEMLRPTVVNRYLFQASPDYLLAGPRRHGIDIDLAAGTLTLTTVSEGKENSKVYPLSADQASALAPQRMTPATVERAFLTIDGIIGRDIEEPLSYAIFVPEADVRRYSPAKSLDDALALGADRSATRVSTNEQLSMAAAENYEVLYSESQSQQQSQDMRR